MKKIPIIVMIAILTFGACSKKEINAGVDSITSDITEKFEPTDKESSK